MRIMNHYLDHVIKREKYVIIECDCQFSGALQSPGNQAASQEDRDDRRSEQIPVICEFISSHSSHNNEADFFLIQNSIRNLQTTIQVTGHCQNYKVCRCLILKT